MNDRFDDDRDGGEESASDNKVASRLPDRREDFAGMGANADARLWETLARWSADQRDFVLATVVDTRGFTPQKCAAHMLIAADGETFGTIGGGAIEREVASEAVVLLAAGAGCTLVKRHLTQELGMCCGGEMSVFLEVIETAPTLHLFGAGYIAKPLAALAAGCGFRVAVVDDRPDWANADRFPSSSVRCQSPEDYLRAAAIDASDYAVVVTHDHALDQRIVQELLRRPLKFVGMIGSLPKQRKFALRLRARGFSDEQIARLHTPLGLSIGARTPEEIAVSVMAQLVTVRRGMPIAPGWSPPAARPVRPPVPAPPPDGIVEPRDLSRSMEVKTR